MALHAFHVPWPCWWRGTTHTALTPVDEKPVKPWILPRPVSLTMVVVLGALMAQTVAISLAEHEELLAVSPGDLALREALQTSMEPSTPKTCTGVMFGMHQKRSDDPIPTLGLVHID